MEEALREIGQDINRLSQEATAKAKQAIQKLALTAHARITQEAQDKLKSTREKYLSALKIQNLESSADQEIWSVTLDKSAGWIEDGYPSGEMIDRILKGGKPAKRSKKGFEYKVIPFDHSKKAPSRTSAAQQRLANYVKTELKKQNLDGIIKDPTTGLPKIGKVASVKITDKNQPVGRFNRKLLDGLTIYQREIKTSTGKVKIKKDIMTFRTISSSQKGSGMWETKGFKGLKAFEKVEKEIDQIWDQMVKDLVK